MINLFKKTPCITLILAFTVGICLPTKAVYVDKEMGKKQEKILLETYTKVIDGTNIKFNVYDDNGVKVVTATPTNLELTNNKKTHEKSDMMILNKGLDMYIDQSKNDGPINSKSFWPTTTSVYDKTKNGSTSSVRHRGFWEVADKMTPFYIASTTMNVRGMWDGNGVADKIQLSQGITVENANISLSIPPSFSVNGSNTYNWTSLAYEDTPMASAYTGDMNAQSLTSLMKVTINSRADVYKDSVSHGESVCSSYSILYGASE